MLSSFLVEGHREQPATIQEILQEEKSGLYTTITASPIRTLRKNYKNNSDLFEITFEEIAMSLQYIVHYLDTINPHGDLPKTTILIDEFEAAINAEQREILRAGYSLGDNLNISQSGLRVAELEDTLRTLTEKIAHSFVLDHRQKHLRNLHHLARHVLTETFTFTAGQWGISLCSGNPDLMELSIGGPTAMCIPASAPFPPPAPAMRELLIDASEDYSENLYLHTLLSGLSASDASYTIENGLRNKRIFLQGRQSSNTEILAHACELYGLKITQTDSSLHITYPYGDISTTHDCLRSNLVNFLPWNVQQAIYSPPPPEDNTPKSKIEQIQADMRKLSKLASATRYEIVDSLRHSSTVLLEQELLQSWFLDHPSRIEELPISIDILLANLVLSQLLSSIAHFPQEMPPLLSYFNEGMLYLFDTEWKGKPMRHFSIKYPSSTGQRSRALTSPR